MKSAHNAFTLIELLVVIAIIGILMGLLFPAVNGAIDTARKTQAKNDAVQIATAITGYETEYGKLPDIGSGAQKVDSDLVAILSGLTSATNDNPRRIVFIEIGTWKKGKSGTNSSGDFVDPWGANYKVMLDDNYDNTLESFSVPNLTGTGNTNITGLRKKVAVWNDQTGTNKRAVRSWE